MGSGKPLGAGNENCFTKSVNSSGMMCSGHQCFVQLDGLVTTIVSPSGRVPELTCQVLHPPSAQLSQKQFDAHPCTRYQREFLRPKSFTTPDCIVTTVQRLVASSRPNCCPKHQGMMGRYTLRSVQASDSINTLFAPLDRMRSIHALATDSVTAFNAACISTPFSSWDVD